MKPDILAGDEGTPPFSLLRQGCECDYVKLASRSQTFCNEYGYITMPRVRYLTVREAADMVMNDLDSIGGDVDVVTIPPDGSDEDKGNNEDIVTVE